MEIDSDKQREELEEAYTPNKEHLINLLRLHSDEELLLDYMMEKRIENNAVKKTVGLDKLWEWIVFKLEKRSYSKQEITRVL
jgi:hypothetical protein